MILNRLDVPKRLVYCGEPETDLSFAWQRQRIGASRGEFGRGDELTNRGRASFYRKGRVSQNEAGVIESSGCDAIECTDYVGS